MTVSPTPVRLSSSAAPGPVRALGVAAFFAVWTGVGWISLLGNDRISLWSDKGLDPGAGLMPALVLTVLSFGTIWTGIGAWRACAAGPWRRPSLSGWGLPSLFLGTALAFPAAMTLVGHVVATFVFVLVWVAFLGQRPGRSVFGQGMQALSAAVLVTLMVHVGFDRIIGVPLP